MPYFIWERGNKGPEGVKLYRSLEVAVGNQETKRRRLVVHTITEAQASLSIEELAILFPSPEIAIDDKFTIKGA